MNKNENLIKQIAVLKMRSKEVIKTFSSVNRMFSIKEDKDDKDLPYDFVSSPSRINFAIIEKTEQGSKVCDVNLTKEEISDLFDQTKILYDIHIKKEMGFYDKGENDNSPCYTETFKMGSLKGKTPAQVGDVQTLEKQKAFLLPNAKKYPDNQKIIDAIDDCLKKIKDGTLNNNSNSTVIKPYVLINEQEKSRKNIKDEKGNSLITGIRIICDFSRRLPINVTITHSYAPIQEAEDGRLLVQASKTVNKKEVSVNLTIKDWNTFISKNNVFIDRYESCLAPYMFKLAEKYAWKPTR